MSSEKKSATPRSISRYSFSMQGQQNARSQRTHKAKGHYHISVGYRPAPVSPAEGPPTALAAIGPPPGRRLPPLIPGMLKSGFPASSTSCCLLGSGPAEAGGGLQLGFTGRSEILVKWLASLARSEWASKLPSEAWRASRETSWSALWESLAPAGPDVYAGCRYSGFIRWWG
jgi:hypothetical protein